MASFESVSSNFYEIAMALFCNAGHAVTAEPIYINHSPEQVVYFDSGVDAYLSCQQRATIHTVANISHLFDIHGDCFCKKSDVTCCFYSIELMTTCSFRSQAAYDAHIALIPFLSGDINIILFRHDGKLMLSMQELDSDVILSDWYDGTTEVDQLADRIDISNISLNSAHDYISDFIYSCARWYYIYPISGEQATYDMLPLDFFSTIALESPSYYKDELKDIISDVLYTAEIEYGYHISGEQAAYDMLPLDFFSTIAFKSPSYYKDELKDIVSDALYAAEIEYGFDFIEIETKSNAYKFNISAELDLLSLEIDMDEELEGSPFGDDIDFEYDGFEDKSIVDEEFENNVQKKDEYEFDDYEDDIFRDPLKMLKFLEADSKKHNKEKFPLIFQESAYTNTTGNNLASFFKELGLEVIDKRQIGGCLWIIGDEQMIGEYIEFVEKEFDISGDFASGKATDGRIGWCTKSNK